MAGLVIFWVEGVRDSTRLEQYKRAAHPTITAAGGKIVIAYGQIEILEGPDMLGVVMVEFPSYEAACSWYHSEAYQEVRAIREGAVALRAVIVESRA